MSNLDGLLPDVDVVVLAKVNDRVLMDKKTNNEVVNLYYKLNV